MIRNQLRNGKYKQVYLQRQTRHEDGIRPMNDSLLELFRSGQIHADAAQSKSVRPAEIRNAVASLHTPHCYTPKARLGQETETRKGSSGAFAGGGI